MKYIFSTLLLVSVALAAPEAPPSNGGDVSASNESGPYPPSGWKPSGRLLLLPARQVAQVYGTPATDLRPPSTEPEPTTTEAPQEDDATFQQQQQEPGSEHGVYHVLLPDGRLQRVEYSTAPLKAAAPSSSFEQQQQQSNNFQQQQSNNYQQQQTNNYQQQQNYQNQQQSAKYEQSQVQQPQKTYAQVVQFGFPSSFPQPLFQEANRYQTAQVSQSSSAQSSQYQQQYQSNRQAANSYAQPQSSRYTQSKNQAQSQYPQQPEYEQGASQNQFNRKQFKQPAQNQNKEVATNNFATGTSSRFTNANNAQQPQVQAEVVEYRPIYYAQQPAVPAPAPAPAPLAVPAPSPQEGPVFTGFVSNVQYKDVEPIATPIYSYNPAPLVRVLRRI